MNDTHKNSDDKKLIDAEQKTNQYKNINKNLISQNNLNNKKIILDSLANITVELGKSKIKIKHFLNFSKGSILMLDKLAEEPLDIFMNGHLIGSGEIVVSENKYGLRIINIKKSLKSIDIPV